MSTLATPEGTQRYATRFSNDVPNSHFRAWPPGVPAVNGLALSSIGFGSYTGPDTDAADAEYAESVQAALRSGINVIDCAINYRHQRSERALGRGLRELIARGATARDEFLVMSKGGYLPFDEAPPRDIGRYLRDTYVSTGLIREGELVADCHCIAPRYLEDQLNRSLANFGFEALDVYFLHNVEQQLDEVDRTEFLARVRAAFEFLESAVAAGRLRLYGAATWNGFRVPPDAAGHLSLEELMQAAHDVAGDAHHFRVLQLPYNPAMMEALVLPTQSTPDGPTALLPAAYRHGMLVVTSVPLLQTQVLSRLPKVWDERMPGLRTPAQRAIQFNRSTPGVWAPLVGMRQRVHAEENAEVARRAPLTREVFESLFSRAH